MSKIKLQTIFFLIISLLFPSPYVLMVSFDGFRYDFTDFIDTPNFDRLEKIGVKSKGLIPVFPSLTFPNHYSIATGTYPGMHNITGNVFYDKEYGQEYNYRDKDKVRDPKFYKAEPIWVTAEKQNVKSASFYWVGTEAPINGYSPSIFKYYDGSVSFKSRIDSVMHWFNLPIDKRPHLIMLYFSEPDYTGHKFGVEDNEITDTIFEMDTLLGYLLNQIEKLEIKDQLSTIVLSDHGMVDVSSDRLIILDDYLTQIDCLKVYGNGAHVQFDLLEENESYLASLKNELDLITNCKSWYSNNIPKRFHFNNSNTGKILLLADEGWFITRKSELNKKSFTLKGFHGYDPKLKNMHGIFYIFGNKIKKDLIIPKFNNIHIYPLVCKLLNIKPYNGKEIYLKGDLKVLNNVLIKNSN